MPPPAAPYDAEVIGLAPKKKEKPPPVRLQGWVECPRCERNVTFRASSGVVAEWHPREGYGYIKPDDASEKHYFDRRTCGGMSKCNIPNGIRVTYTEQWRVRDHPGQRALASWEPQGFWVITAVNGLWKIDREEGRSAAGSSRTASRRTSRRGLSSVAADDRRSRSAPASRAAAAGAGGASD